MTSNGGALSITEHVAEIAQKIAYAMQVAVGFSIKQDNPEWCELLSVSFPDAFSENVEPVKIIAMPARAKVRDEVARLYIHPNDLVSIAPMRDAVRLALEPFVVGGRQLAMQDIPEGFEVVLRDDR
jgi:hypothetical protein